MSKNMLIIDDDTASRDLLRLVFEYDGFRCWEAENGAEGLTMLESQAFDIIILDNAMPIMTGLEFLNHIQHRSPQSDVPIIMSTGLLNPEVRKEATKLGAYAIVGKPHDLDELGALVSRLCITSPSPPQNSSLLSKESS